MQAHANEVAYCTARIARSTALALASTDSCARASHVGLATAYGERLASLTLAADSPMILDMPRDQPAAAPTTGAAVMKLQALSRWDTEGGALAHDAPAVTILTEGSPGMPRLEADDLRARVLALEHIVVAMLAGGSSDQRAAVHDMALFVRPLLKASGDRPTTDAAEVMDQLADRGALFSRVLT